MKTVYELVITPVAFWMLGAVPHAIYTICKRRWWHRQICQGILSETRFIFIVLLWIETSIALFWLEDRSWLLRFIDCYGCVVYTWVAWTIDDDEDRWKRRKAKLLKKVKESGGRLVVAPAQRTKV